jgi:hypothetical protein
MDVRKINNTYNNLAIKNGVYSLIADRRPNLLQTDTIKLSIAGMREASCRFDIDPSALGNTGLDAFLIDKFLQTQTTVSFTKSTSVPFNITSAPASYTADRFMIVFKQAPTTNFTTISAIRNADKTVTINWGTSNERNVTSYNIEQSNDGINFTSIGTQTSIANNGTNPTYSKYDEAATKANNWYRVKLNNSNATNKYSAVAMVGALNEIAKDLNPTMSIYPNPVVDGNVNLHLDNQQKGSYHVQITNTAGQVIKTEKIQVENNYMRHSLNIRLVIADTYNITITSQEGKKTTLTVIVF